MCDRGDHGNLCSERGAMLSVGRKVWFGVVCCPDGDEVRAERFSPEASADEGFRAVGRSIDIENGVLPASDAGVRGPSAGWK